MENYTSNRHGGHSRALGCLLSAGAVADDHQNCMTASQQTERTTVISVDISAWFDKLLKSTHGKRWPAAFPPIIRFKPQILSFLLILLFCFVLSDAFTTIAVCEINPKNRTGRKMTTKNKQNKTAHANLIKTPVSTDVSSR